jgi:hypothetical protein
MAHYEPPYDPSLSVENWHDLGWYFDGILISRMSSANKTPSVFSFYDQALHTQDDVLALLHKHERVWLAEVESAISLISISGEIDLTGFSPEAISIVARRAETIAAFIDSLHISEVSIFGLPQRPFGDCIRWLMTTWWDSHGRQMAVDVFLSDRTL